MPYLLLPYYNNAHHVPFILVRDDIQIKLWLPFKYIIMYAGISQPFACKSICIYACTGIISQNLYLY